MHPFGGLSNINLSKMKIHYNRFRNRLCTHTLLKLYTLAKDNETVKIAQIQILKQTLKYLPSLVHNILNIIQHFNKNTLKISSLMTQIISKILDAILANVNLTLVALSQHVAVSRLTQTSK